MAPTMSVSKSGVKQINPAGCFGVSGSRLIRAALLLLLGGFLGCRTVPIQDVVDAPLPAASRNAPAADLDEAIWRAGRKVGWDIERLSPGRLRGTWRFKRHSAVVSITYRDGLVSIGYVDSVNLLHEGDRIHHEYNTLVQRLLVQIQHEPLSPGSTAAPPLEEP